MGKWYWVSTSIHCMAGMGGGRTGTRGTAGGRDLPAGQGLLWTYLGTDGTGGLCICARRAQSGAQGAQLFQVPGPPRSGQGGVPGGSPSAGP